MKNAKLSEALLNITTESGFRSVKSLFQLNSKKVFSLNYKPLYQRKYIWPWIKATNLIETILLHGEIPPIVIYEEEENLEVIDGRQRCETIDRYLKDEFGLRVGGLNTLWNLAGKKFSQLDKNLQERIKKTNLRIITIKSKDGKATNRHLVELAKREVFKRYNLGISPLRKEEVYKAQYLQEEINVYFKKCFKQDVKLYDQVKDIFDHRSRNLEVVMQHIRQLFVLHYIPISRYVNDRDDIVNMYYDYLSYKTAKRGKKEDFQIIFEDFKRKLHFLNEIKILMNNENVSATGLIYECLYWALSVCEKENMKFEEINSSVFKMRLVGHIVKNIQNYLAGKTNYAQQIRKRYGLIASFFSSQLKISFERYLNSNDEFLVTHKEQLKQYMKDRFKPGLEEEYFSKPLATSKTIEDFLEEMKEGKFSLMPPYQRDEVMNYGKASSLIESMLLELKINPIYVYLRENGIAEVIDGQQRLLAIIGFLGERYRNENGDMIHSKKDRFRLDLKSGILTLLDKMRFDQLLESYKNRIYNYKIDVIEIKEKDNEHFKPEELFKRINSKPFPIKPHSFEFWNAYIDNDIIASIKDVCKRNNWLYLRRNDKRMLNEELVTCLCYLHHMTAIKPLELNSMKEVISVSALKSSVTIKIRNKSFITKMLENDSFKEEFLLSLNSFEGEFIEKVRLLTSNSTGKTTEPFRNKLLDNILHAGTVRTSTNFYALWLILKGIPVDYIKIARSAVQSRIDKLFSLLRTSKSVEKVESFITETWNLQQDEPIFQALKNS